MRKIAITGSEGLIGNQLSKYFGIKNKVFRLDVKLGHDLTDEKFVKKWFHDNPVDYLINCFAVNDHVSKTRKKRTLYNFTTTEFFDYLNINLISLFSVCREFARSNRKGSIVNFSSIYGIVSPHPDLYGGSHKDIGYCVSKAGVINMTKYLAVHLAPKIRINCIVPGGLLFKQNRRFIKKYSDMTPMKRMLQNGELNSIVDHLCSTESSYMTGATIVVDGGYTLW